MKHRNKRRGLQKVHTFSCYDDTWDRFTALKKKHNKTADEMMNIIMNGYELGTLATERKILTNLKNQIQKQIQKL